MATHSFLKPVAEPQIIEGAFSEDQRTRLFDVMRRKGPWATILSQEFTSPAEVIATTSGIPPVGFEPTWDMFLSPVFRATLGRGHAVMYPEIEDCFYNTKFLNMVRGYWNAEYAAPNLMLCNIQGPAGAGGPPHVDGADFRGATIQNTPSWLIGLMTKSGLFRQWQSKKAQVLTWYYKGQTGGGFTYWPDGPQGAPKQLYAPMWGRGAVVENEVMYHGANACGLEEMRKPDGLAINSVIEADAESDGWQIMTDGKGVQQLPADEVRMLFHWGADIFTDLRELTIALDHSDDLTHDHIIDVFLSDLRARGVPFKIPTDPLHDPEFIQFLTGEFDPGLPTVIPLEYGIAAE